MNIARVAKAKNCTEGAMKDRVRMSMRQSSSSRGTWVLIMIMGVGLLVTLRYLGVRQDSYQGPIDAAICKFRYESLPTKIWSHRAHFGQDTIDGSISAVKGLLESGITSFDVDVSCRKSKADGKCEFVVAHPSLVTAEVSAIQTVSSFLDQIRLHWKRAKLAPTITLEMKFNDPIQQQEFVHEVQQSLLADRVAVIGADPQTLAGVVQLFKRGGIAAAYRSLPLTDHDYNWPKPSATLSDGSVTMLPPLLTVAHRVGRTDGVKEPPILAAVDIAQHSQTLHIHSSGKATEMPSGLLQIYMPDAKLVQAPIVHSTGASQDGSASALTATVADHNRKVVAWVVDDVAVMWDLLGRKNVDAVISNRPVEMLQELRNAHRHHCR